MYRPTLVTPPSKQPLTAGEVKEHVKSDEADDNNTLAALLAAAVTHVDGWSGVLGRCLITQTWRQDFDNFSRCLRLPLAPVSAVTAVTYKDVNGAEQTVAASNYALLNDDAGAFVRFKDAFAAPSLQTDRPAVSVTYTAGYGDGGAAVPSAIKQAMLLLIGHWYENREAVVVGAAAMPLPFAVDALLAPFRRVG